MATACSALLSASALLSLPINLAIDAVTPVPKPIVRPRTRKNRGMLKAIPAISSPPNRPMNIISTMLYNVCIPIPAIIGIANVHNAFDGFSRNLLRREVSF